MRRKEYCPDCNLIHRVKIKYETLTHCGETYNSEYCFCKKKDYAFRTTKQLLSDQAARFQIDDIMEFIKELEESGETLF